MNTEPSRFVAVVQFGDDASDRGVVFATGTGLDVRWPDGHADVVHRDARGWLWDEYGEVEHPVDHGRVRRGTRLPVVSRRARDGAALLASLESSCPSP